MEIHLAVFEPANVLESRETNIAKLTGLFSRLINAEIARRGQ
jgi:hypothetical protein